MRRICPSKPPSRRAAAALAPARPAPTMTKRREPLTRRSYHRPLDGQSARRWRRPLDARSPHRLRHVLEELACEVGGQLPRHLADEGESGVEIIALCLDDETRDLTLRCACRQLAGHRRILRSGTS